MTRALLVFSALLFPLHAIGAEEAGDYVPASCTAQNLVNAKPIILGPIYQGDTEVRIHNQVAGGTITITSLTWGLQFSGSTQNSAAFPLAISETGGDYMYACQVGGVPSTVQCSDWVQVQTPPATLDPPQLPHLVLLGGQAIGVAGVHPGADVIVEANGVEVGRRWAGSSTAVSVPIPDTLAAFTGLTVRQSIGSVISGSRGTSILPFSPDVSVPRIMGPVRAGDTAVWVSAVSPGSRVSIIDVATGTVLASKPVGEPIAKIAVCPLTGTIRARVARDGHVATSANVPLTAPPPARTVDYEYDFDYGLDPVSNLEMKGRIYDPDVTTASNPVVFLVHGNPPGNSCVNTGAASPSTRSYLGYEYLAHALVKLGFIVYSLELPTAWSSTDDSMPDGRAQVLLATIDEAMAQRADIDVDSPLGFFGHSLGADGVIYARSIVDPSLDLRGVVSVAPTTYSLDYADFDPADGASVPLLHVYGGHDYFVDYPTDPNFRSLAHYDRAWGAKSQLFIDRAGHNAFNTCWGTEQLDGALSIEEQQSILAAFAVPFFEGLLTGAGAEFAPYFQGTVRPRGTYHHALTMMYHTPSGTQVIDDFGDPQDELTVPDVNTDIAVNAQGGTVTQTIPPWAAVGVFEGDHDALEVAYSGYIGRQDPDDRALLLRWDMRGHQYVSELPAPLSASMNDVLSFRVMAVGGDPANDLDGQSGLPTDLMVELSDGTFTAKVRAGSVGSLLYPFLDDHGDYQQVFRTVRIPMDAFKTVTPAFNLANITSVSLGGYMRETGLLVIDDLELSR